MKNIKVLDLLNKAKEFPQNEEGAKSFLEYMKSLFDGSPLSKLRVQNEEAYYENIVDSVGFFVSWEFSKLISNDHAICIKPELRNNEFGILVTHYFFKDGKGAGSQDYEVANNGYSEELISTDSDEELFDVINQSLTKAKQFHAEIFERVGITKMRSFELVDEMWL